MSHPLLSLDFLLNRHFFISVGMKKPLELFYFFHINDFKSFKPLFVKYIVPLVTSTSVILSPPASQPNAYLNVGFSASGLNTLGISGSSLSDPLFNAGQFAGANALRDVPANWDTAFAGTSIHGVFLIGSDKQVFIDNLLNTITASLGSTIVEVTRLQGSARPGFQAGHERKSNPLVENSLVQSPYNISFG